MTQIIERSSTHGDDLPEPRPSLLTMTMAQAITQALNDAMAADDRVLVFGEDVATLGGVFRVTDGLAETFGDQRCFDTPLAESAIIGIAIGMAVRGFVPVPEIQFDGFSAPAFDQMVSHLAKYRMRTHGDIDMPVTVRIPSFGGIGAVEHHSESTESYWLHTAGLKVVAPSTPSRIGCCASRSPAGIRSSTWNPNVGTGPGGPSTPRRRRCRSGGHRWRAEDPMSPC